MLVCKVTKMAGQKKVSGTHTTYIKVISIIFLE